MEYKIKESLEIPQNSITKIRKLAKDCCNYAGGECMALDCDCVVCKDEEHINCKWFINCVLPMDTALNETVLKKNELGKHIKYFKKTCKVCGTSFKTTTKNKVTCDKCLKKLEKERKKAYKIRQSIK